MARASDDDLGPFAADVLVGQIDVTAGLLHFVDGQVKTGLQFGLRLRSSMEACISAAA